MKRFTYLAAMLLVMAGAVSCEKKAGVNDPTPQPTGEMRQVTITAGQGAERTSVFNGVLTWSDGDELYIVPTAGGFDAVALGITEGAGFAIGTFEGMIDKGIKDDTPLYGWAGGAWTYSAGTFTIEMTDAQTAAIVLTDEIIEEVKNYLTRVLVKSLQDILLLTPAITSLAYT